MLRNLFVLVVLSLFAVPMFAQQTTAMSDGSSGLYVSRIVQDVDSNGDYVHFVKLLDAFTADNEHLMTLWGTLNQGTLEVETNVQAGNSIRIGNDAGAGNQGKCDSDCVSWTRGLGAPTATCGTSPNGIGSIYSNFDGTNPPLYVCASDGWHAATLQ